MKVKLLNEFATLPSKAGPNEAGFDLFTLKEHDGNFVIYIAPGELLKIKTGLAMEIPEGYYGDMRPRSSAIIKGLHVAGTIDSSYRGEITILMRNLTDSTIELLPGKAYAQIVITPYARPVSIEQAEELSDSERGTRGFGSSGSC